MSSFSRPFLTLLSDPYEVGHYEVDSYEANPYAANSYAAPVAEPMPSWPAESAGDDSWRLDALCAETDPEAFFPEKGGSTREAKRVCGGCTVRAECLEAALANDERFGIWGGLSERERRRIRVQRRESLSA